LLLSAVAVLAAAGLTTSGPVTSGFGAPPADTASADVPIPPPRPGGRIAFESGRSGNYEIYTMDANGGGPPKNLTDDPAYDVRPAISPDGTRIAFTSDRRSNGGIYVMNADGTGRPTRLPRSNENDIDPAFSADGRQIVFASYRDDDGWNIYVADADGDRQPERITNERDHQDSGDASSPSFSPDGEWIAYTVGYGDTSERQIYRIRADGSGRQRLTADGSNWDAAYSPDGNHIAFASDRLRDAEIYTMTDEGHDEHDLTKYPDGDDEAPAFSPDGQGIVFTSDRDDDPGDDEHLREIYVMDADGSNQDNLTKRGQADDASPSWGKALPCAPDPDEVAIYEDANYEGRCVRKGIGRYDTAADFVPMPGNSASSIRVGNNVEAVLADETTLGGARETFTENTDFSNVHPIPGEDIIGDDRMSSFKVQPRGSSAWSIDLALPHPRRWINTRRVVGVTATLRRPAVGPDRPVPGQRLSFAVTAGPNANTLAGCHRSAASRTRTERSRGGTSPRRSRVRIASRRTSTRTATGS
jgi:Tol biopolymer transport system component